MHLIRCQILIPDLAALFPIVALSTGIRAHLRVYYRITASPASWHTSSSTDISYRINLRTRWLIIRFTDARIMWLPGRDVVSMPTHRALTDVSWSIVHSCEPTTNLHDQICPNEASSCDRWRGESVELSRREARTLSRIAVVTSVRMYIIIRTTHCRRGDKTRKIYNRMQSWCMSHFDRRMKIKYLFAEVIRILGSDFLLKI